MQGKQALGPHAGRYAERIGRGTEQGCEYRRGKLCADDEGFSLHAGVLVPHYCRDRLEALCRYAARPPLVHQRLSLSANGAKVVYKLKKKFRDGSTHVVLDPLDFIARLAALVSRPRIHLVTYHGVLAPTASFRDRVVPAPPNEDPPPCRDTTRRSRPTVEPSPEPEPPPRSRRRFSWAELLRRVYLVDVLTCEHCGARRKVLAFLTEPLAIRRILEHLDLPDDAPALAPARAPPQPALPF